MIHEFVEILKEIAIAVGFDVAFKKFAEKEGVALAQFVEKKLTDEHRAELLAFIRELATYDKEASDKLLDRQRQRQYCARKTYPDAHGNYATYAPGEEDRLVTLLTKLYMALADNHEERSSRIEVFTWLGHMEDREFDAALEFLHHDVIFQWFQKARQIVVMAWPQFYSRDPRNPGLWQKTHASENIKEADRKIAGALNTFNAWLDRKGVR